MEFMGFLSGVISRERPVVASRYIGCLISHDEALLKISFVAKTNI